MRHGRDGALLARLMLACCLALPSASMADVLVGNPGGHNVLRFDSTALDRQEQSYAGEFVTSGSGGLKNPRDIAISPGNGQLYVASGGTDSVLRYSGATGEFLGVFVAPGSGGLRGPTSIAFGPHNDLYVAQQSGPILRYDGATGAFVGALAGTYFLDRYDAIAIRGNHLFGLGSVAVNPAGARLYQIDEFDVALNTLVRILVYGNFLFSGKDLALGAGNTLYVADYTETTGFARILAFDTRTGMLQSPFVFTPYFGGTEPTSLFYGIDSRLYMGYWYRPFDLPDVRTAEMLRMNLNEGFGLAIGGPMTEIRGIALIGTVPEPGILPLLLVAGAAAALAVRFSNRLEPASRLQLPSGRKMKAVAAAATPLPFTETEASPRSGSCPPRATSSPRRDC